MVVHYVRPEHWIAYDPLRVAPALTEAKACVLSLKSIPFQRTWADKLQQIQLKMEVAGTSRIEGAEFTERELEDAVAGASPSEALTRSQKQARAAVNTYRWLADLPRDYPVSAELLLSVHRRLVTGCDEDHCEPGALRPDDHNVTFGTPRHRGVPGGDECRACFSDLMRSVNAEFREHDILIQAAALHYHIGAMHPFGDGNGRTARAMEAFLLQKAGLRETLFIALSNYYYDEKTAYLSKLAACAGSKHNLTEFLLFSLTGVKKQCERLLSEINLELKKALFRDMMNELFNRMRSTRKRVIAKRQVALLNHLLDFGRKEVNDLFGATASLYANLSNDWGAFVRDVFNLMDLGTVTVRQENDAIIVSIRLDWPQEMSGSEAFRRLQNLPRSKTYTFMQRGLPAASIQPTPG